MVLILVLLMTFTVVGQQQKKAKPAIDYGNNPKARKCIAVNGIKMYYEIYGTGEQLLLLHSNGGSILVEYIKQLKSAEQDAATKNTLKLFEMMTVEPNISLTDLQKIECSVFVIGGDSDAIKPSHTIRIFENIPNAYLWIFPVAGHGTLQRYSLEFNTKVNEFFTQPFHKTMWNDFDQ